VEPPELEELELDELEPELDPEPELELDPELELELELEDPELDVDPLWPELEPELDALLPVEPELDALDVEPELDVDPEVELPDDPPELEPDPDGDPPPELVDGRPELEPPGPLVTPLALPASSPKPGSVPLLLLQATTTPSRAVPAPNTARRFIQPAPRSSKASIPVSDP